MCIRDRISVNRSTISHLLSGRNKPSLDFVMKVLEKFPEVELYWILNGKGNFPSEKNENTTTSSINEKAPIIATSLKNVEKTQNTPPLSSNILKSLDEEDIDRIIIFYKDGSFKSYKN